jgi:NAD(P)-dependent dehydrogenase (short-subunit alcohol dehydrogenase family)
MQEFHDRVALVTGAGSASGREISLAFSRLGAQVAANDINPINLDNTVERIKQAGGEAGSYVFDIAKRMPIEGMLAQVIDQFGRIDFLINHAAVQPDASLLEMDEWEFHRTLEVNLAGPFFTMQQVGRLMQEQGGGAIVNVISSSTRPGKNKGHSALIASRAGLIGLTGAAARELSDYNIRVNAVFSRSSEVQAGIPTDWDDALYTKWLEGVPEIHQTGYPGMVSKVLFLCSTSALSLTGQVIEVDPVG